MEIEDGEVCVMAARMSSKLNDELSEFIDAEVKFAIEEAKLKIYEEAKIEAEKRLISVPKTRAQAVKTLRKTQKFGRQDDKIDFEWPKESDLSALPTDRPVKIERITYRTRGDFINQVQVHLTNGHSSPLF